MSDSPSGKDFTKPGEVPMYVVTLMDYPDDDKYNLMEMIWIKRVLHHAPNARIRILSRRGLSRPVQHFAEMFPSVTVEAAQSRPFSGFDHFNLSIKLYSLSQITEPFLFLDADMFVISDLDALWRHRNDKPWIGVDDQTSELRPASSFSHLNSGMQLVSDPTFYDYEKILACFEANGRRFLCGGEDQAVLFDYFKTTGYDYRHPDVDAGWNCCSRYARLSKDASGAWQGLTRDFPTTYPVHIVHYWNGSCRPWHIGCPLFTEEARHLISSGLLKPRPTVSFSRSVLEEADTPPVLRVGLLNSPPESIRAPGEHPFFPLSRVRVEWANPDQADLLFWHLRPERLQEDYRLLVYRHHQLFREQEHRFLLHTTARRPSVLYLNNALSLTPFPVYPPDINRLSNVFPVPWLNEPGAWPCLADEAFLAECRAEPKQAELVWVGPLANTQADQFSKSGVCSLLHIPETTSDLAALPADRRDDAQRALLRKMASAKFYLHRPGDPASPMLLYHALLVGVPPVLPENADMPYNELQPATGWALIRKPGFPLGSQLNAVQETYASLRRSALTFADTFCRPDLLNDQILLHYVIPILQAKKADHSGSAR